MTYIPYQEIAENLGLKSTDTLLITSDISKLVYTSIKHKEKLNGELFIDSFNHVLKEGTLLFPAFIDNFKSGYIYDKLKSIPEMGALSKIAFESSNFLRSNDPLHSFLVRGKHANSISKIECDSTFGKDSVFGYLRAIKAKMLLIDVDLEHGFTFVHHVEEQEQVPYRKYVNLEYESVNELGGIDIKTLKIYSKKIGVVNKLNRLEPILIEKDALKKIIINNSVFRLIDLDVAYNVILEDLKNNKGNSVHAFDLKLFLKSILKLFIKK